MSDVIIDALVPILADIGKVAIFINSVCLVFRLAKNAFFKGELSF